MRPLRCGGTTAAPMRRLHSQAPAAEDTRSAKAKEMKMVFFQACQCLLFCLSFSGHFIEGFAEHHLRKHT